MNLEHYLVVGLGKTGHSIARYLQRQNIDFSVFDTRNAPVLAAEFQAEFPQASLFLETLPEEKLAQITQSHLQALHELIPDSSKQDVSINLQNLFTEIENLCQGIFF